MSSDNYLRQQNAVKIILDKIEEKYDQYIYVDQDALNELYYNNVIYVPWALYNCPPRKYIVRPNLSKQSFDLVDYEYLRNIGYGITELPSNLMDVTEKVYDTAHIIHYAGHRKPWKDDTEIESESPIFEQEYEPYAQKAADMFINCITLVSN